MLRVSKARAAAEKQYVAFFENREYKQPFFFQYMAQNIVTLARHGQQAPVRDEMTALARTAFPSGVGPERDWFARFTELIWQSASGPTDEGPFRNTYGRKLVSEWMDLQAIDAERRLRFKQEWMDEFVTCWYRVLAISFEEETVSPKREQSLIESGERLDALLK